MIRVLTTDGCFVPDNLFDAPWIVKEMGINYEDKIVRPILHSRIRDNIIHYEAISLSTKGMNFIDEFLVETNQ